jgi:hypothetical protein
MSARRPQHRQQTARNIPAGRAARSHPNPLPTRRNLWSVAEDINVTYHVGLEGPNWTQHARRLTAEKSAAQVRGRYTQVLNPALKRTRMTAAEEVQIINAVDMQGNRWAAIARSIEGRTGSEVRRWYQAYQKRSARERERRQQQGGQIIRFVLVARTDDRPRQPRGMVMLGVLV